MNTFIRTITSKDEAIRNRSFFSICKNLSIQQLISSFNELEVFRTKTDNLYERVRASLFLYAGYRFILEAHPNLNNTGEIPQDGFVYLLNRRFEEAISIFQNEKNKTKLNGTLASVLAEAYHQRAFQILGKQVRHSVRSTPENQWMFRKAAVSDHPIRIHKNLKERTSSESLFPILQEKTSVRMDLTHSGWSDIFFLGMDYPTGARVINVSTDLGVYGRDKNITPPIQSYIRVINEPLIRLTSIDLGVTKDIHDLADLFNFGNDYLSLLKAGIISSGLIPPSFEGTQESLKELLGQIIGPEMGFELVTMVNDIPKGSRFAVSTNLLSSIISLLMRATHQIQNLEGQLTEPERRLVAARAILGEWLGGSGGGWQDSGGIWPGIKAIEGVVSKHGDPEFGISRGCLLPQHRVLSQDDLHPEIEERLTQSLVLMHGGMAQNVGPVLEMVTEKFLLRNENEWKARLATGEIYKGILSALKNGDITALAKYTNDNWKYPIKTIIPWASNHYTETIIKKAKAQFGNDYLGFMMLGGMSGGGMGMYVKPQNYEMRKAAVLEILRESKSELDAAMPFAMNPVVYNFKINKKGSISNLLRKKLAFMPERYYDLQIALLAKGTPNDIAHHRKMEIEFFTSKSLKKNTALNLLRTIVSNLFQVNQNNIGDRQIKQNKLADQIKKENGFDHIQHTQIRDDLQKGIIGLTKNRLPLDTKIENVRKGDVIILNQQKEESIGIQALQNGKVAVLSLAGGIGSRWTQGAGVIKALNPFVSINGKHRSFLEIHLAKSQKTARLFGSTPPHIIATSFLTNLAIKKYLSKYKNFNYSGQIYLSSGKSIGQRLIPMAKDLKFLWEEMPQEILDENKEKVRDAIRKSLITWVKEKGEGSDYVDNLAQQRFSPQGHWYEVPNLIRNGVLAKLLKDNPQVETLMLHNIDTLGADLNPKALTSHLTSGNMLSFEVVPRRYEDRGGGLARVNGQLRLLEGLAQPNEKDELRLSYYNTMTTWIQIDDLLNWFGVTRSDLLKNTEAIDKTIRKAAQRLPSYVTIKDVKYRWGHGQEDIYPVAQIEKLWSDMSSLNDVSCTYLGVKRKRGQQLKDPAQLDAWVNDGSKEYVAKLCGW